MTTASTITRIGLISDTHNLVRPEALLHLAGCDAIIHAGDICEQAVLDALGRIAPVTAVRGNNDTGDWARALPTHATLKPLIDERDGVLFVNPGSAGPRRFKLPVSAGLLIVDGARATATLHSLLT
jgi:predicted phosphodiesterase